MQITFIKTILTIKVATKYLARKGGSNSNKDLGRRMPLSIPPSIETTLINPYEVMGDKSKTYTKAQPI